MDAEKSAFGESQEFQGKIHVIVLRPIPTGLQVERVVPHEHRQLVWGWWRQWTDREIHSAPFSCPIGREVATDASVKLKQQAFIQRRATKILPLHGLLQASDALTEKGC